MGKLSDIIFGKPKRKRIETEPVREYLRETKIAQKLKQKRLEREAYHKGYAETKVRLARERGRRAAKTSTLERVGTSLSKVGDSFAGAGKSAESYMKMFDMDFGLEPMKKRATNKKRK